MTGTTKTFQQLYRKLNKAQREATDAIEGPVTVVAGPGTGKTLVLTLRIANILKKTDADPENILALTFTDAGANEMRRRLAEIIGSAAYRVEINTFHGFCNDVIQRFPESFPHIIGSTHLTQVEQIQILKKIISASRRIKKLRPFGDPFHYLRDIARAIEEFKKEDLSPAELKKRINQQERSLKRLTKIRQTERARVENEIEKLKELAFIYQKYEQALRDQKRYDFSDMIVEVIRALEKNQGLRLTLQEQYLYLLADEHQDANSAQNKVLELLAAYYQEPNLFIVGDEKQAIFRFQGASLENFRYFQRKFSRSKLIALTENYRSTQSIIDAAQSLIASKEKLRAAEQDQGKPIRLYEFSRPEVELYFLARELKGKSDAAVIYRDNRDVLPLLPWLEKMGVAYVVESDQDILEDTDLRQLTALLRAVNSYGKSETLVPVLHAEFLGLEQLAVYKLIAATARRGNLYESLRDSKEKEFRNLSKNLSAWASLAKNRPLLEVFETIVRESGFLDWLLAKDDSLVKLGRLDGLFEEVKALVEQKRDARLADFITHLDLLAEHNILLKRPAGAYEQGRVRLMTGHRAKGQEFEEIYIMGAFDGHWGNRHARRGFRLPTSGVSLAAASTEKESDDERRLFYVALTRAKRSVAITYVRQSHEGRERLPSQFVAEIRPELIEKADPRPYEDEFLKNREIIFAPKKLKGVGIKNKKFIRALFRERPLAVTHLNNYLACPWKYFYLDLLRIPRAMSKHQMYGSAVHRALAHYFRLLQKEGRATKAILVKIFRDSLLRQPLAEEEFAELAERGERVLAGYHDTYAGQWRPNVLAEFKIRAVPLNKDVILTGALDKIEFVGLGRTVNVVDYKTGQPRSRNYILGKTKDSSGDYWRQLVFYKLLLDRAGKYQMVSGEIDFVEPARPAGGPTKTGRYRKECFEVSNADVKALEEQVSDVADEITNLKFWNRRCDDPKCEFCALREAIDKSRPTGL